MAEIARQCGSCSVVYWPSDGHICNKSTTASRLPANQSRRDHCEAAMSGLRVEGDPDGAMLRLREAAERMLKAVGPVKPLELGDADCLELVGAHDELRAALSAIHLEATENE